MPAPVPPNMLDRAVAWLAPERAMRRHAARQMLAITGAMTGGYGGARRDRKTMEDWGRQVGGSPNADLLPDLPDLRERSRDLERNEPIATGVIATRVTNIVGTGIWPEISLDADLLGLSADAAEAHKKAIGREWDVLAGTTAIDLRRTSNVAGLQRQVCRGVDVSGDMLAIRRHRRNAGEPYGLKVQLVEGDRQANPRGLRDGARLDGGRGNVVSGGVEIDGDGAPVAYHVLREHPGSLAAGAKGARETDRHPAFDANGVRRVLHLYDPQRPEQDRGVPLLAPVVESLKQLGRYKDAELQAAVLTSFFAVFLKSPSGGPLAEPGGTADTAAPGETPVVKVGPASVLGLKPGQDVTFANPTRPNVSFDPFVLAFCRQIGVAVEMPYELLVKHFTASYSAARAALLEAWKTFRARRGWLVEAFCEPVFDWMLEEAALLGRLDLPGFFADPLIRRAWAGAVWIGPPPGQIDELKEIEAAARRIETGVSNLARETAYLTGENWESTHRQRVIEIGRRRRDGLDAAPASPAAAPPGPPEPDPDKPDSDEETA